MTALIDPYDAVCFDLDGVIYRGPAAVPGAPETLAALREAGKHVGYVTNNAQRSPSAVGDQLRRLGIDCADSDIVTSAQAMAHVMARDLVPGSGVLVVGTAALAAEIAAVGLRPQERRDSTTAAIVVGFDPDLRWNDFNEACYAVQDGATWYACNNDYTRPTENGCAIGMGGMIEAMRAALPGRDPVMAGKPYRPLLDETIDRLGATRPLFVGDRLDTDIEGARNVGIDSLLVLSGSHGKYDLVAAGPALRPTYVGDDIGALLEPARVAYVVEGRSTCVQSVAEVVGGGLIRLTGDLSTSRAQSDALWAIVTLVWDDADKGGSLDATAVLDRLTLVR